MKTEEQTNWVTLPNKIVLPAEIVNQELTCPICLQIIKDAYVVRECLHRFCLKCIEMALRVGKKQCPSCRAKCPSKRSCRKDKPFDDLIRAIYPDLGAVEKRQEEVMRANLAGMRAFQEAAKKGRKRQQELLLKYKKPRLRKAERSPRTEINRRQHIPRVPQTQPSQTFTPREEKTRKRRIPHTEKDSKESEQQVTPPPRKKRTLEPRGYPRGLATPSRKIHQNLEKSRNGTKGYHAHLTAGVFSDKSLPGRQIKEHNSSRGIKVSFPEVIWNNSWKSQVALHSLRNSAETNVLLTALKKQQTETSRVQMSRLEMSTLVDSKNAKEKKSNPQPVPRVALRDKQFYVGFYTVGHNEWEGWMELEETSTFFLEQTWRSTEGYMINTKTYRGMWSPLSVGGFRIECSSPSSSAAPTLANEMLLNPQYPGIYFDSQTGSICMKRVQDNYVTHLRTRKQLCLNFERQQASLQKKEIAFFLRRKNSCPHGELEKDNLITGLNASIKHLCRYLSQNVVIDPARCRSLPHNKLEAKNFEIFIGTRLKLGNGKFKDIERKMTDPLPYNFTLNQTIKLWNSEAELDLEWQVIGI